MFCAARTAYSRATPTVSERASANYAEEFFCKCQLNFAVNDNDVASQCLMIATINLCLHLRAFIIIVIIIVYWFVKKMIPSKSSHCDPGMRMLTRPTITSINITTKTTTNNATITMQSLSPPQESAITNTTTTARSPQR